MDFPLPEGMRWRESSYRWHGKDIEDRHAILEDRKVVDIDGIPWPAASPEECIDYGISGDWIADGKVLICPGCGLDCT